MLIYYAISNEGISSCAGVAKANSAFICTQTKKMRSAESKREKKKSPSWTCPTDTALLRQYLDATSACGLKLLAYEALSY